MKKKKSASAYTRQEAAHYDAIKDQERYIRRLEYSEESAKRQYALAKKRRESAQARLHEMIMADPAQMTLPGLEHAPIEREARSRWQDTPLSIVIHDEGLVKALAESKITTLGSLAAYTNAGHALIKLKGISESGEAKIVEQLQMYWQQNPEIEPKKDEGGEGEE